MEASSTSKSLYKEFTSSWQLRNAKLMCYTELKLMTNRLVKLQLKSKETSALALEAVLLLNLLKVTILPKKKMISRSKKIN